MPTSVKELLAAANAAVPKVGREEAAALMAGGALVVDVRDAPELQAAGKVKGAVHVSRGMLEFRADPASPYHDKAFDPDRTVLLYCASGGRSALAAKALQDLGYKDVRNLGGFKDWAKGGGAVEPAEATKSESSGTGCMARVLFVGFDPETVDFSDPALQPGMTAAKVTAGIEIALQQMAARGWKADLCFIQPDEAAVPTVERQLATTNYDCVVIGAGVRIPPKNLVLFEALVNAARRAAPAAAVAFNTRPEDGADAAARWVGLG